MAKPEPYDRKFVQPTIHVPLHLLPKEVVDKDFFDIYQQFVSITGIAPWTKRIGKLAASLKSEVERGFHAESFPLERSMARVLGHLNRFQKLPPADQYQIYLLYAFIFNTANVYQRLSEKGRKVLRGRLVDALKEEVGLSPLAFEMSIVGGLSRRDCRIGFNDFEGSGGFDFLVDSAGLDLEIECKTLREDIGRRVKRRAAIALYRRVSSEMLRLLPQLKTGLLIKVVVPDSMEVESGFQSRLAGSVVRSLRTGVAESDRQGAYEIELRDFAMARSPFGAGSERSIPREALHDFVREVSGEPNREVFTAFRPGSCAVILVLTSARGDQDVDRWFKEVRDSAKLQFTKTRPGVLCIHLDGLTEGELVSLSEEQGGHRLQDVADRILGSDQRAHLASVVFFGRADDTSRIEGQGAVTKSAPTYVFQNHLHPSHGDFRANIFGANPSSL